ncbi:cadherin-related family member 3-like [Rhinoraja longicauda]
MSSCQGVQEVEAAITFESNPAEVNENEPIGTVVTTAKDATIITMDPYAYSLSPPVAGFQINAETGLIITTEVFDFESKNQKVFQLGVQVNQDKYRDKKFLQVSIQDVKEPPVCEEPKFVAGTDSVEITENVAVGTHIYTIHAKDDDSGDTLNYVIESKDTFPTNCGNVYRIDQASGAVFIASSLDYDAGYHTCRLTIQVEDKGKLSCRGALTVNIQDLNDEPPVFKKFPKDTVDVSENEPVGTIITTVEASDRDDGNMVTYKFATPVDRFNLNENSGDIRLVKPLDFDNPDLREVYLLSILASDDDLKHTSTYTLTVLVIDVDEAPICDPAFAQGAGASTTIPEDFPAFKTVYRIIAKDPDPQGEIEFTIISDQSDAAKYFSLDPNDGIISRTNEPLDYDQGLKQYKITISVNEVGKTPPKSCTGTITINIQNLNDESPVYLNPLDVINIPEDEPAGTIVAKFTATDRDVNDRVFYEFASKHKGFTIDENTGELKLTHCPDYEDTTFPHKQILEIRAFDSSRVHSVTATVTVNIIDLNDNAPQCQPTLYNAVLAETDPPGTPVTFLNCWDNDLEPSNNHLTYTLVLDSFSTNRFSNSRNEIQIGLKGLDYDESTFEGQQFKHTILIKISDGGAPSLTSTATLIVRVTRRNEWNPKSDDFTFPVAENSPIGTIVGFVKFTDADLPSDSIRYSIASGNNDIPPRFYMEPNSGQLKVLNLLDAESAARYSLTVQAVDLNNDLKSDPQKQRTSFTTVTVNILNINDEPPICNPAYYETTIYSTIKTPFLQLHCSDKDSANDQLSYLIVGGNTHNRFVLRRTDMNLLSVATTQSFQFDVPGGVEDPTDYQLLVQVTDEFGGTKARQLTSTATVVIHIIPWTTTQPATSTPTTPFTTAVLIRISWFWRPQGWFVALLVLLGASAFAGLYVLAWALLKNHPRYGRFFPKCENHEKTPGNHITKAGPKRPRSFPPLDEKTNSSDKWTLLPVDSLTGFGQFCYFILMLEASPVFQQCKATSFSFAHFPIEGHYGALQHKLTIPTFNTAVLSLLT